MSENEPPLPANYFGFPNLAGLKTAHARLVQRNEDRQEQNIPADEFLDTVTDFVIRAQATGHVLGHDEDRTAAQNIIDYWVTVLLRGRRTPPETGLAEFHSGGTTKSVRDRPVAEYLAEERTTIRRRLGLSAAAAQWDDAERPRTLLWGGRQLDEAAAYDDLSPLEREFIAESRSDERRSAMRRQVVVYAALLAAGTIVALVVWNLVAQARLAREATRQAQHLFATKLVERSGFLMRQGDIAGALLWLTAALHADHQAQHEEHLHRLRIGTARAQLPKLEQVFLEENAEYFCANTRLSADGTAVLTISNQKGAGGMARLWEAHSGRLLAEFPEPAAQVNDAGFCADGRIFTATGTRGSGRGRLRFWQRTGEAAGEFENIGGPVIFAVATPDADRIGFCIEGLDGQPSLAEVRRVSDGQTMTAPLPWKGDVLEVSFNEYGEYFIVCGAVQRGDASNSRLEGMVRVWNAWTGADLSLEMQTTLPIGAAAFSPDNLALAVGTGLLGGNTGTVEAWKVFEAAPAAGPGLPLRAVPLFRAEHGGPVPSVCFSPDGRRVLSASHDETARVWEARQGTPLLELRHESTVFRAAYSPDGRWIVSGGRDQVARVWSVATGRPAVAPLSHPGTVSQVRFDSSGDRVLTTAADGGRLWHLRTGEPVSPLLKLDEPAWKMTISTDATRAVAISRRGAVGVWDTRTGRQMLGDGRARLPFHEANGAFFSADASQALVSARPSVGSPQEVARLYRLAPTLGLGATLAVKGPVTCAAFSADGTRVFVASGGGEQGGGSAGLWEVAAGKSVGAPLTIDATTITFAAFSPDGHYLLTAGGSTSPVRGEARVWSAETGEPLTEPLLHDEPITHASFNREHTLLITASVDDSAKIWALDLPRNAGQVRHRLAEHSADLGHAAFSPDGKHAVTASFDRTVMIWRLEDGRRVSILQHPGWINDAQFSADGRFLVTACSDQIARVWEVSTGDLIALFRHAGDVTKAAFSAANDVVTFSVQAWAPPLRDARPGREAASSLSDRGTLLKVQTWRLPRAGESVEELAGFAKIVRARRIENERDLVRLTRSEYGALWKKHHTLVAAFAADLPPVSPLIAVDDCEATADWFAARWHLSRLLSAQPDDPELLVRRGFASAHLRRWSEAAEDYERAVALSPAARTFLRLTRADLELGRFREAIDHATKGLTFGVDHELFMMRAEGFAAQELWDGAAEDLARAIALQPLRAAAYERLAAVRLKQNQPEAYRTVCAQVVEKAQRDPSIAGTAAWACTLHPEAVPDPQVAVDLARLTLLQQPTPYYDLNTLGAALFRAGQLEEALEYFRQSRSAYFQAASRAHAEGLPVAAIMPIQDGRPVDWIFMAMIHAKLGHRREAEDWLKNTAAAVTARSISDPRRIWHRLEVELLLEEAKSLMATP